MSSFKEQLIWFIKRNLRSSFLPVLLQEKLLFLYKVGYWPNFKEPRSFTEKLHIRKLYEKDRRLVELSDKFSVRRFVEKKIGKKHLIPLLYAGKTLNPQRLLALGNNVVVRRNDDSGSTILINRNTLQTAEQTCGDINRPEDYGRKTNEWWYREIEPLVLVERYLHEPGEYRPIDYKFFVFEASDKKYLIVETIRRREDGVVECGFYDDELNPVTVAGQPVQFSGCVPFSGPFPAVETFPEMKKLALKLSEGLNFIRVDLYSIKGRIYFGELTFCPSEGRTPFDPVEFDFELGKKWEKPVLLTKSSHDAHFEGLVCNN